MPWWWPFPVAGAFVLAVVCTYIVRGLALRYGVVDAPDSPRKIHRAPMPLLGGAALYCAFALPTVVVLCATGHFTAGDMTSWHFVGLLGGGAVLVVGGALDDVYDLPAKKSFLFPLLAACVATVCGIGVAKLTNPFGGEPWVLASGVSALLTFGWLLATTYTTKLLDGIDGLAASIPGVATLVIAALALTQEFYQPDVALLAGIAAAAIAGFLLWNFYPARIFLGEGGSTFLGFLVGTLAVISGGKLATALMVMGIPALDVAFVILRRVRAGKNPFTTADRGHLHHLLLDHGWGHRHIVLLYTSVALVFGLTSLVLESWQKLIALGMVCAIALGLVWRLSKPGNV